MGPTFARPVQDPLAVTRLENGLNMTTHLKINHYFFSEIATNIMEIIIEVYHERTKGS